MSTVTEEQFQYTFKLKGGSHYDRKRGIKVEAGGLYHTDEDMIKLYGRNRWEKIKEGEESIDSLRAKVKALEARMAPSQPSTEDDDLKNKSIKELRAIAAGMEPPVDLTTCNGKDEIINTIRQAMDAA